MLPPYELKNKEFSKVMRGYNPLEVDEHISFIIEKYTELYRENDELERKLKAAYAKLDEIKNEEESIKSAMVNAQRASAKIMTEANDRADIIINTARKSCDRILADFKLKIQEERAVLIALNSAVSDFKDKLFKTYNSHISFIEEIKLLDEEEIAKYALSDDNYSTAVIQNIKQDIMDMNISTPEVKKEESGGFVEADPVSAETSARSGSVKETIKEINRRFYDDDIEAVVGDLKEAVAEASANSDEEAEREYQELLKQLGAEYSVDTPISDEKASDDSNVEDGFSKAYKTPMDYVNKIRRKKKQ